MKRILFTAVAIATMATSMGAGVAVADPPYGQSDSNNADQGRDHRNDGDHRDNGQRGDERGDAHGRGGGQAADQGRWDQRQHNGYYLGNRWHYGPPQDAYYGREGFRPGYQAWARGQHVPRYYRGRYSNVDYREHHLRRPPHGYRWVEDDRGSYLLIGIATGVILSAILNH